MFARLRLSAFAAAAALAVITAPAAAQQVKIGFVAPFSGPFSALGDSLDRGVRLFEKIHGKDLPPGVSVEILRRDDAGVPDSTRRFVQELIVRDKINVLTGVVLSPQGFAIAKLTTEAKLPTAVMVATTSSLTRSSPYFVRFSYTQWQGAFAIGEWAAKNGIKTASTLVADYAAGHDSEAAFKKAFEDKGGKVVGSIRAPATTTDFLPFMERIKAENPQALFMFVNSGRVSSAAKAFQDSGLKAAGVKLVGPGDQALDDELRNMSEEVAGLTVASTYSAAPGIPANDAFIKAWKAEFGPDALPNVSSVSAWDAMSAIYEAIRKLGPGASGDAILESLRNWRGTISPRGDVSIDPATRDVVNPIQMVKVEIKDGKPTNVVFERLPPLADPWKAFNP